MMVGLSISLTKTYTIFYCKSNTSLFHFVLFFYLAQLLLAILSRKMHSKFHLIGGSGDFDTTFYFPTALLQKVLCLNSSIQELEAGSYVS